MLQPDVHAANIARASPRQCASWSARGEPVHIHKGGVHHFVPLPGDRASRGRPIDVSMLNRVLDIDVAGKRCVAEPGVTFAELVKATLPHGLIPTVVPELEGITVGGAVAGCSVEAMSIQVRRLSRPAASSTKSSRATGAADAHAGARPRGCST